MIRRVLAIVVAITAAALSHPVHAQACSWSDPGADPFKGNPAQAILTEPSLPLWVRPLLVAKRLGPPTDRLDIWQDAVTGRDPLYRYSEVVRGMRFGKSQRCDTISRPWPPMRSQPADAWCVDAFCYVVPDVCGNPSFIRRYAKGVGAQGVGAQPVGGAAQAVPEPASAALVLAALAACAWRTTLNRQRRAAAPDTQVTRP